MCTGQIFFKKTAIYLLQSNVYVSANNIVDLIVSLLKVPYFFLALVIYACATFLWLFILQKVPLSVAYPFTALAMVIIPLLSIFLFDEKLDVTYWFGSMLIVSGIIIMAFRS